MQKMIYFHDVTKDNIKEHSLNGAHIFDHLYRIIIVGVPGCR